VYEPSENLCVPGAIVDKGLGVVTGPKVFVTGAIVVATFTVPNV